MSETNEHDIPKKPIELLYPPCYGSFLVVHEEILSIILCIKVIHRDTINLLAERVYPGI